MKDSSLIFESTKRKKGIQAHLTAFISKINIQNIFPCVELFTDYVNPSFVLKVIRSLMLF